jgi:hypothetical protein
MLEVSKRTTNRILAEVRSAEQHAKWESAIGLPLLHNLRRAPERWSPR